MAPCACAQGLGCKPWLATCMLNFMARTAGSLSLCSRRMPFSSTRRSYRLSRRRVDTRPSLSARTPVCQRALRVCTLVHR